MASIYKEIHLDSAPEEVWAAVRDIGAVHQRLFPGVLVDARLEADARIVTFANGMVVRERTVTIDDRNRRYAWAATGGQLAHHNASIQVQPDPAGGTRFIWITDVLPDDQAGAIGAIIEQGAAALERTWQRA